MREISGDIGPNNRLSTGEKLSYLFGNFFRAVTEWSLPGKVRGWNGVPVPHGSDSPGRNYIDSYLRQELPKLVLPGRIRVLDIGCGTGYIQTILAELGYTGEYVGLDVMQEPGFAAHTEAFSVSFVEGKIEDYIPHQPFDLVLSNTTLEHVEDDRAAAVVAERVLTDDGIGLHLVPSYWSLFLYLFHGYRQYTPNMVRKAFRGQDYTIVGLGGAGSFLLHLLMITLPERIFGRPTLRDGEQYQRLVAFAAKVDRVIPIARALFAIIVKKRADVRTKVLFAMPSILVGGIEQQLMNQLARYDRTRFSFGLVTLFEYEGREDLKSRLPSDVRHESIGMKGPLDLDGWKRLIGFLREFSPDLVVSSMFSANTALRLLKPFFRYNAIAREHNIYDEKTFMQRLTDRVLASVTCRIIAVSKDVARFASKQAGIRPRKFAVIQNGVDLEKFSAWQMAHPDLKALKRELGFSAKERIIMTVGRLKSWKNHAALLTAFKGFSETHPEYRLVIIGTGAEHDTLIELVRSIPNERALLLERYGESVWPYYATADWFILPSLREGFPNVMLEAMAFGLPVLATDISGSNECVEDGVNGFLIPASIAGIKGSLARAAKLSPAEVEAMRAASRARVEQFSITETVRKYEAIFSACRPA